MGNCGMTVSVTGSDAFVGVPPSIEKDAETISLPGRTVESISMAVPSTESQKAQAWAECR